MEPTKIDITSTALEKGIDTAKLFLEKLILPSIAETGLLLKDHVTMWKFRNQVKMLNKARLICEQNNISSKTISLKLLCPLLDYSGIEEDEILLDKWAILLSNLVDSEQNIQNHVFPYILSQLSLNEFLVIEKIYDEKREGQRKLNIELNELLEHKNFREQDLNSKIKELEGQIEKIRNQTTTQFNNDYWTLHKEKQQYESQLSEMNFKVLTLNKKIKNPGVVPNDHLHDYEISNVIRLGIVKEEKEFYAASQTLEIPNEREYDTRYINVDLDIDVDSDKDNILTELGELFINACKEKNSR